MTQKPDNLETAFEDKNFDVLEEAEQRKILKLRRKAYGFLMLACQNDPTALQIATAQNVESGDRL